MVHSDEAAQVCSPFWSEEWIMNSERWAVSASLRLSWFPSFANTSGRRLGITCQKIPPGGIYWFTLKKKNKWSSSLLCSLISTWHHFRCPNLRNTYKKKIFAIAKRLKSNPTLTQTSDLYTCVSLCTYVCKCGFMCTYAYSRCMLLGFLSQVGSWTSQLTCLHLNFLSFKIGLIIVPVLKAY